MTDVQQLSLFGGGNEAYWQQVDAARAEEIEWHRQCLEELRAKPAPLRRIGFDFDEFMQQTEDHDMIRWHEVGIAYLSDPANVWIPETSEELLARCRAQGYFMCGEGV